MNALSNSQKPPQIVQKFAFREAFLLLLADDASPHPIDADRGVRDTGVRASGRDGNLLNH